MLDPLFFHLSALKQTQTYIDKQLNVTLEQHLIMQFHHISQCDLNAISFQNCWL